MQIVPECQGEPYLRSHTTKQSEACVPQEMRAEQPHTPTALPMKPCRKSTVANYFKKLKLCQRTLS